MRQIFLLFLLFIVGQWLAKALRRHDARTATGANASARSGGTQAGAGAGGARGAQTPKQAPQLAEPMICCAECGVHAPKSDSVIIAGEPFCSADHAHRHAVRTGTNRRDAR